MRKWIALFLCLLMPFAAIAEETDLTALWEQLAAYKADLEGQSASLDPEISSWESESAYVEYVLEAYKAQLALVQGKKDALTAKITSAEELLVAPASAELAEKVQALLPPPNLTGKHYVQIEIANYGTIIAELDADAAPITVTNFVNLANKGFYNGTTFHRIINGFMMQGGAATGNNYAENIKGEFAQNGYNNPIAHERGVLSMARSNAPDSANSQFFIMHQAAPHLNGAYAAFGHVISGIEVVDAICAGTPVTDGNGTVQSENQPVIASITVIEKPAE